MTGGESALREIKPATRETARRRPVGFRVLAAAGAASFALVAAGAWLAYEKLLHYERKAALHLPDGATWAARIDVEQGPLYESVRRNLMPLLDRLPMLPAPSVRRDGGELRRRLRADAGINLGFQLREIVVAGGSDFWCVLVGGLFDEADLIASLVRVLKATGAVGMATPQPGVASFEPWGVRMAAAADGVLVVASDATTLQAALGRSRHHPQLGLPTSGAIALAATRPLLEAPGREGAIPEGLGAARVHGRLGDAVTLEARLEPSDALSRAGLRAAVAGWLETPPATPTAEDWGQRALLLRARLRPEREYITISSSWTQREFGRALLALRGWVERRMRSSSPPPL